jgi:hypothetical protein
MAKKKDIIAVVLTEEQLMEDLATSIVIKREEVKKATKMLEADEERLEAYLFTKGMNTIGTLRLEVTTGPLELTGAKNKALDIKKAELLNELDIKYVKKSLDKEAIFAALQSDNVLFGILAKKGLSVTQGEQTLKLKLVK